MKKIIIFITKKLAQATLARYRPKVVGITGNVGKTSTKDAVAAALSARFRVRKSEKSYNNELGLPLTILGFSSSGKNIPGWIAKFLVASIRLIYTRYPEVLVLEMGVDKPKDMEYLLQIVTPDIAVFTSIGDMPVHVENFINRDALIREKLKLASAVSPKGHVVYNADVSWWEPIRSKIKAGVLTYGFSDAADVKLGTPEMRFAGEGAHQVPLGIACKVEYKGSTVPFRLDGILAQSGAYFAGAACAVGSIMGMHLVEISSAMSAFMPPKGRLRLIEGVKGSSILDDTYNASPSSMRVALDALASLPAERRIAVLGDMLELGVYSEDAHRELGKYASGICSAVYTVGMKTKFTHDELASRGFRDGVNLFSYDTSDEAARALYPTVQEGDMILVKGSRGMRMEKAVRKLMAHPESASELLIA